MTTPSTYELLQLELDIRLADLWHDATAQDERGDWNLNLVGVFMRWAYAQGYGDGRGEVGRPYPLTDLLKTWGYKLPERKAA